MKLKDRDLPALIQQYLKAKNASIDPKSTQMIADAIGSDLSRLTSELDKVLLGLPEGDRRVTPQIVEDQIGVSKDYNPFEMRNAIVNRNVEKANRIMKYFCSNPKSGGPYVILPQLFSYFQNLMIAYYAPNKNNDQAMAQYLGLRSGWAARDYLTGLRNYSGRKVLEIISKIRETDAKIKGIGKGNATDSDLMQELIFFIMH
jgi:DNA polymerase-3 subunit delta